MRGRIALLSCLALCAAYAAACTDASMPPVAHTRTAADTADQVIWGMQTVITDQGLKRADVLADTAYFYDDNSRMDMNKVIAKFFTSTGLENGILTSDRGVYDTRTGVMEGFGHVIVTSTDGRKLTTSQLKYDRRTDKVTGDSAFTFVDPDQTTEGIGFDSDPGMNALHIHRYVKGTAGTHTLPKR